MKPFLLFLSFVLSTSAFSVALPRNLSVSDRKTMLELLGYGSQSKLLSSPVPLGGWQGFEVGLSSEYIPIEDLSGLGNKSDVRGEYNIINLTLGKGIFYNVDTFVHVTPLPQGEGVSSFGGQLRWGFLEFNRLPGLMSVVIHGSGTNFANLLNTRTTGADLVMTVAMDDLALYFGGGTIRTIGTFLGGAGGITAEGTTIDEDLNDVHTVFGLSMGFDELMLTLEIDRVVQSTYGGRLSWRF